MYHSNSKMVKKRWMDSVPGAFMMDESAMWRVKKTRSRVVLNVQTVAPPPPPNMEMSMNETTAKLPSTAPTSPHHTVLGQTLVLRGELSAKEDLLIGGQFEGTISVEDHCLTVGAEGQVKAEIRARQVVILGTVTGKIVAREKVEIRRSGRLTGDLMAGAVAIEEGAYFKGSIDILREEAQEGSRSTPLQSALETSA
jgi:cytoskeletal protein CcmA (bactofilin family)